MRLSQKLGRHFDSIVQNRGKRYFWQGRVRIRHGSEGEVEALVRGFQPYQVRLAWREEGVLTVGCTCEYFKSKSSCKHLWATILSAEQKGYLAKVAAARTFSLEFRSDGFVTEFDEAGRNGSIYPAEQHSLTPPPSPKPSLWRQQITAIHDSRLQTFGQGKPWPANREILYIVDVPSCATAGSLVLSLGSREPKAKGDWTRVKPLALNFDRVAQLPKPEDRELVAALAGATQYFGYISSYLQIPSSHHVTFPLARLILPQAARLGRCYLRKSHDPDDLVPLTWDEGGIWHFKLEMRWSSVRDWVVIGVLRRGEERMDLAAADLLTQGGLIFARGRVAPLAEDTPFEWISYLRKAGSISAPERDKEEFLSALLSAPGLPPLEVPEELRYEEVTLRGRPCLRIRASTHPYLGSEKLKADLSFEYEGKLVAGHDPARGYYQAAQRRFLRRDVEAETAAAGLLNELGLRFRGPTYWDREPAWEFAPSKLPRIVRALVEAGWHIEAEGKVFRRPGAFHLEVSTGVDWFELHGKVEYGEATAKLPELLEALRRGENVVRLDDGTYGMLPEEWLRRIGLLAGMGTPESGHLRFRRSQAGVLDALLAAQPEARCDETFARLRKELRLFDGVEPAAQPAGFVGHLRDYQRQGLGWMQFLARFSFGGCLADDMGVGKTVQVLALLEARRELRGAGEQPGPSLVVVPRSLLFNWKVEAARFTPKLRVLEYAGAGRNEADFASADLILTTYGTLRRDVLRLKDVEFDYVVLDEAQAVKNPETEAAKAARLLRGAHRLALSGTPVENHLGELWSLFEFLNPGMLGAASVFKLASGVARNPDEDTRRLLARALKPFFLRRTKEQVAPELPPKTEQTIHCEMDSVQRRLYDELREHYRAALLKQIEVEGLAKSKIQVLEALLRLRQAACHPGLIDPALRDRREGSAKLESLMEQLRIVLDEGHKALVFSQFTSLLRIVRDRLESEGVAYEYLDGDTRDRQSPVERFQNEPDCRLFLISLKAGGLGLNLTAAEYVFLLDPWWNPAVEAQAVDRAHRIGQTRQVFAYRLIARDTVEEKVLELQKTKRDLAAAIISEDNSLLRNLRREDLELLLS